MNEILEREIERLKRKIELIDYKIDNFKEKRDYYLSTGRKLAEYNAIRLEKKITIFELEKEIINRIIKFLNNLKDKRKSEIKNEYRDLDNKIDNLEVEIKNLEKEEDNLLYTMNDRNAKNIYKRKKKIDEEIETLKLEEKYLKELKEIINKLI